MDIQRAAATPSPSPDGLRTPPAPRFGYQDPWEPFSPRKSARISSQRTKNITPPPKSTERRSASPRTSRKANEQGNASMASPAPSPRKRRQAPVDTSRRISGNLTAESTAHAAVALGIDGISSQGPAIASRSHAASHMLPTPSKTPQKAPSSKTSTYIQTFARNLFPSDESSLRRRRGKKYSGMTMDSFTAETEEAPIQIFTDSHERVPTKDTSASNPFYVDPSKPQPSTQRSGKARQVNIPGEGAQSVTDAAQREDGMVYVFRGKRFFRKFSDVQGEGTEGEVDGDATRLDTPLTRASIKPRLLFPQERNEAELEEEEADTDVEEDKLPQTPSKSKTRQTKTPEAPKFAPVSPPDTGRTTRSTNKFADQGTPMKKKPRQRSIFDSWPRTKEHKAQSGKRPGETLDQAPAKRTRA